MKISVTQLLCSYFHIVMFDFLHVFERRTKGESRKAKVCVLRRYGERLSYPYLQRLTIASLERSTYNDSLPIAVGTIVSLLSFIWLQLKISSVPLL